MLVFCFLQFIVAMKQVRRQTERIWARVDDLEGMTASIKRQHEVCVAEQAQGQLQIDAYYNQWSRAFQAAEKEKAEAIVRFEQSEAARKKAELDLEKAQRELHEARSTISSLEAEKKTIQRSLEQANLRAENAEKRSAELSTEIGGLTLERQSAQESVTRLEGEIKDEKNRSAQLTQELSREREIRGEAIDRAEGAEAAMKVEEDRVHTLDARARRLRAENKKLIAEKDEASQAMIKEVGEQIMAYENRGFHHGWMAAFKCVNMPVEAQVPVEYPDVAPAPDNEPDS